MRKYSHAHNSLVCVGQCAHVNNLAKAPDCDSDRPVRVVSLLCAVCEGDYMRCPRCGCEESKVIDSRPSDNHVAIRRRRECTRCGTRFTTYERREESPLLVVKKDGTKETFDRQKVMRGLIRATVKRNIPMSTLDSLLDSIESELRDNSIDEISSHDIGNMVLKRLLDVDKVAYVRFASVYRDFKDVDEFANELRSLQ